jgi:hypothetical protein
MTNANYCRACRETLTLHADGSIACSCEFLDADSNDGIPTTWALTEKELADIRAAEAKESR